MRLQRSTGLVGHWKFNEKSGITANDSSRYRNTGTLVGATHLPVWSDKGIKFDGVDDYVDAGNNPSLNFERTDSFTISVWAKSLITTTSKGIVSKGISSSAGYGLDQTDENQIRFYLSKSSVNRLIVDFTPTGYYNNVWSNLVCTYNGNSAYSGVKCYENGVSKTTDNVVNTLTESIINSNNIIIGAYTPTTASFFNGSIDEVRIYNRSLSANEIKRHYEATKHNYI